MLKVQEIREIIKLIDQSSISDFTYESNGTTVSMKKSGQNNGAQIQEKVIESMEQPKVEVQKEVAQIAPKENKPEQSESASVTNDVTFDYEIVSPMVGTFYAASSPENDVFVKLGSIVENDTVVCIVEAMKLFNEIEAEVQGEIVELLVKDGELVEYGQPLFRVKKK